MEIDFCKMHGCGNDFIIIDNRENRLKNISLSSFTKKLCERKFNIGANGLMLVEDSLTADFRMRYFNADGSEGEMCGNGARCIAKFAYVNGIASNWMNFETFDENYRARVLSDGQVKIYFPSLITDQIKMDQPFLYEGKTIKYHYGFVGVPHTIFYHEKNEKMEDTDFTNLGRAIRYDKVFPKGTNVNGVHIINQNEIAVRTYERGVEEETFACGTGATASAIISSLRYDLKPPIQVKTRGGYVVIDFNAHSNKLDSISLIGNAEIVFEGKITYKKSE